jgi:hypothetical protein
MPRLPDLADDSSPPPVNGSEIENRADDSYDRLANGSEIPNRGDDVKAGVAVGTGVSGGVGTGVAVARGEADRVGRGLAVTVLVRVARHVGTNEILAPSVKQFVIVTPAPVVENVEKSK